MWKIVLSFRSSHSNKCVVDCIWIKFSNNLREINKVWLKKHLWQRNLLQQVPSFFTAPLIVMLEFGDFIRVVFLKKMCILRVTETASIKSVHTEWTILMPIFYYFKTAINYWISCNRTAKNIDFSIYCDDF